MNIVAFDAPLLSLSIAGSKVFDSMWMYSTNVCTTLGYVICTKNVGGAFNGLWSIIIYFYRSLDKPIEFIQCVDLRDRNKIIPIISIVGRTTEWEPIFPCVSANFNFSLLLIAVDWADCKCTVKKYGMRALTTYPIPFAPRNKWSRTWMLTLRVEWWPQSLHTSACSVYVNDERSTYVLKQNINIRGEPMAQTYNLSSIKFNWLKFSNVTVWRSGTFFFIHKK